MWSDWSSAEKPISKIIVHCPVCAHRLGFRFMEDAFSSHCAECMATYTYLPNNTLPTALLDIKEKKTCHCENCYAK